MELSRNEADSQRHYVSSLFFQARRRAAPRAQEPKGPNGPKGAFGALWGDGPMGPFGVIPKLFRMEKPFRVGGYYERKSTPKPKKAVREKIIKNSSKTDHVQHRGALWPEMTPNATETAHLELLGGLGSAMCRNDPKWYQNKPFGTSGRLGPKWSTTAGPEMVQNATETIRN